MSVSIKSAHEIELMRESCRRLSIVHKELEEAMKNYRAAIGLLLTVSPTKEERSIEKSTIGINHRYAFNGYGSFDSTKMEMKEEFTDLYKEAGFGSIRYPELSRTCSVGKIRLGIKKTV